VKHRFFYEGRYFGDVENPLRASDEEWLCLCCGRTFAVRLRLEPPVAFEGPLRWEVHRSLCEKCLSHNPLWIHQYEPMLARFIRPYDASNQLSSLRAQFLYDSIGL